MQKKSEKKTNEPFPKTNNENVYFWTNWHIFGPILSKPEISQKNPVRSLLSLYSPLTSCKKSEKSNEPDLRKSNKCLFLAHFGPVLPNLGQTGIFLKK